MRTLHIGIRVSDLDESLAFYEALGYQALGTVPETEFGSLTMLKLPDDPFVSIELVHDPEDDEEIDPGGLNHFVIQVDDLRDFVVRLAERGIEAEPPASPDESEDFLTSWVLDPDGYGIELVQWPDSHPEAGLTEEDLVGDDAGE